MHKHPLPRLSIHRLCLRACDLENEMITTEDCTWGSLKVNLRWYYKLLFPLGLGIVCPLRSGSVSPSVTGGGNQETGQRSGRSSSRDSTVTSQMSDSLWASRKSGRWETNCPWCRDCRSEKPKKKKAQIQIFRKKCVIWQPWPSIHIADKPSIFYPPDSLLHLSSVTHSTTDPTSPTEQTLKATSQLNLLWAMDLSWSTAC